MRNTLKELRIALRKYEAEWELTEYIMDETDVSFDELMTKAYTIIPALQAARTVIEEAEGSYWKFMDCGAADLIYLLNILNQATSILRRITERQRLI